MSPNLQIEDIYKKVTQLEHVLSHPDIYIGSVEYSDKASMWVYDAKKDKIILRDISFVPGLYKIFDEILVTAADNKQRDPKMDTIKVTIDKEKNEISVYHNGQGIPIKLHKTENMYFPEMIFGTLLTLSNYNDDDCKATDCRRNGYGVKLCNIFSTKFTLETHDGKKHFKQTWVNNMKKDGEPEITEKECEDFTKITFSPDLVKFKMDELDDDIIGLMSRRAYDVAGSVSGIEVFLNGKQLPCKGFKQCIEQYTKDREHNGEMLHVAYESPHACWQVGVTVSEKGFQQVSFVNSIATTKGGCHVDFVVDQITASLTETGKRKIGKGGVNVKPFQVKNHLWVFVNALIEYPIFDSQTKETLNTQAKDFGSRFKLSDKFLEEVQEELQDKKCSGRKIAKLKGVPDLEDANDAGTNNSQKCTLILTEGYSAKSLAVAGLGVIGRDHYGVFPLRGKMLNVREATHKQIMGNAEVNALLRILGLQYGKKYTTEKAMESLRYGKVMIMADQDQDGSHIKGLVINFIHHNWPHLLRNNFLEEFITPIIKATKDNTSKSFYSLPEYKKWRQNTDNWKSYKIKYYKGLGTSSAKEAKEYFSNMEQHKIRFEYSGKDDDTAIDLAFSKKRIEDRKEWLTQWMGMRRERRERGEFEDYLYEAGTRSINFSDFINKELILFSNADNERSIPSLVDGLKPSQRKIMFTCFKRADKKEVKVTQLAGAVGETSAYHHRELLLMATIINMAHDFIGSNNINLLMPNGQFGTRLQGGKDAASARYIFTQLNSVTKTLFPAADENVLRFLYEENQRIEPEWYCPIIPVVLVNGAEGIGTGWSTKVPNYNPRDIVENIRRLIRGEEQEPLSPWYKKFRGQIEKMNDTRHMCLGEIAKIDDETLEITELPIKVWTQTYKEKVLEPMLDASTITDFKEYHTEETVKFVLKLKADKLEELEEAGLHQAFKLQAAINTTSMVLFGADGVLRKYTSPEQICQEFFTTRKRIYIERKDYLEGMLQAQSDRLSEQARFILMKINDEIKIENKSKAAIVDQLIQHKFKPDPVKAWKDLQKKKEMEKREDITMVVDEEEGSEEEEQTVDKRVASYDYLVGMAIWKLSAEGKDKLMAESKAKEAELKVLQGKSWSDLWEEDLVVFLKALDEKEDKDEKELVDLLSKNLNDVLPSKDAVRIEPDLVALKKKHGRVPATRKRKVSETEESSSTAPAKKPAAKKIKKEESSDEDAIVRRFNGLVNQGATCYMNSVIQMMFFTNCLRRIVYCIQKPDQKVITSLQRLFYEIQFGTNAVQTRQLTESLRLNVYDQQDIQEFCRLFFDKIESIIKGTKMENMLSRFFKGKMRTFIKCVDVGYESSREEDFYDLSLTVKGMRDVYESFENYTHTELLHDDNEYDAEEHGKQKAEKGISLVEFPRVLHLHLKRFDYDAVLDRRYKINDRFEFYERIDLNKYIDPKYHNKDDYTYVLQSVLVHSGRSGSGHYKVFIDTGLENGQRNVWHCFNDSFVSSCTPKEAIDDNFGEDQTPGRSFQSTQNAYMLVYIQENKLGDVLCTVTKEDIPIELVADFSKDAPKINVKKSAKKRKPGPLKICLGCGELKPHHAKERCNTCYKAYLREQKKLASKNVETYDSGNDSPQE